MGRLSSVTSWLIIAAAVVVPVAVLVKAAAVLAGGGAGHPMARLPLPPARVAATASRHHPAVSRRRHHLPSAATDAAIVGAYEVVGHIVATHGFSGEKPGEDLLRAWLIQRACTRSGCRLMLTRSLAAVSGVPPISAVLHPAPGGWTAHFTETQGCPDPSSPTRTTEYSTWRLRTVSHGLEASETGQQPASGPCASAANTIRWYARKLSHHPSPPPSTPSA